MFYSTTLISHWLEVRPIGFTGQARRGGDPVGSEQCYQ